MTIHVPVYKLYTVLHYNENIICKYLHLFKKLLSTNALSCLWTEAQLLQAANCRQTQDWMGSLGLVCTAKQVTLIITCTKHEETKISQHSCGTNVCVCVYLSNQDSPSTWIRSCKSSDLIWLMAIWHMLQQCMQSFGLAHSACLAHLPQLLITAELACPDHHAIKPSPGNDLGRLSENG